MLEDLAAGSLCDQRLEFATDGPVAEREHRALLPGRARDRCSREVYGPRWCGELRRYLAVVGKYLFPAGSDALEQRGCGVTGSEYLRQRPARGLVG